MLIATLYHPMQLKKANIWFDYYHKLGYDVAFNEVDLTQVKEHDARNALLKRFEDQDYIFTLDTDEFLLDEDIKYVYENAKINKIECGMCPITDYVTKDACTEQRTHKPIILVDPKKVTFTDHRCVNNTKIFVFGDTELHHLWYLDMEWKKKQYKIRNDNEIEKVKAMWRRERLNIIPPKPIAEIIEQMENYYLTRVG